MRDRERENLGIDVGEGDGTEEWDKEEDDGGGCRSTAFRTVVWGMRAHGRFLCGARNLIEGYNKVRTSKRKQNSTVQ